MTLPATPKSRSSILGIHRGVGLAGVTWTSLASVGSGGSTWKFQGPDKLHFSPDAVAIGGHLRFADTYRVIARGDFLEGLGELEEDQRELAEYRWDINRETGWIHRRQARNRLEMRRQRELRMARGQCEAENPVSSEQGALGQDTEDDAERGAASSGSASGGEGERATVDPAVRRQTSFAAGAAKSEGAKDCSARRPSIVRFKSDSEVCPPTSERLSSTVGPGRSSVMVSVSGAPIPATRRWSRVVEVGNEATPSSARRPSLVGSAAASAGSEGKEKKEDFSSLRRRALVQAEDFYEEPEMKTILKKLKLKTGRENRLQRLSELQGNYMQQSRMARLKDLRHRDFENLPSAERRALSRAFEEHTDCHNALSARQLRSALRSLGIRARSDLERTEIILLCNEVAIAGDVDFMGFVFEVVPRARQVLRDLRRPLLEQHLNLYDTEDTTWLSMDQCTVIFERLCLWDLDTEGAKHVRKSYEERVRKVRELISGQVYFKDFEVIISEVQEQVERLAKEGEAMVESKEQLDEADMKAHKDELLQLHESFSRVALQAKRLPREKLRSLLVENGLCPPDASVQEKLEQIVEGMLEEAVYLAAAEMEHTGDEASRQADEQKLEQVDAFLNFKQFLRAVRFMREMIVSGNHFELSQSFTRLDKSRRGCLHFNTVLSLLDGMGIVPRHLEDKAEIWRLLAEANNGSGEVEFPDFERLVLRVRQRLKAGQRFRAAKAAFELRLKDAEAADLREIFNTADIDGLGELTVEQLDRVMEQMHRPVALEDKEAILLRLCGDGPKVIDMEKFFRYVRAAIAISSQVG